MTSPAGTFVMTGLPRAGTTYLSAVLHHPPRVITISDPQGTFRRFYREHGASAAILDVFDGFRRRILSGDAVPTLEGTAGFAGKVRVDTWNQAKVLRPIAADRDFVLGMKNPEVFLAHLDVFLAAGLRCVISVRHPLAVIASWRRRSEEAARATGEPPRGFGMGEALHFTPAAKDPFERCLELHNHWARWILLRKDHPQVMVVRHEDWFTDPGLLRRVGAFLDVPVRDRLHPPPIAPDPPRLPAQETERVLAACTLVEPLGYPIAHGMLLPPSPAEARA